VLDCGLLGEKTQEAEIGLFTPKPFKILQLGILLIKIRETIFKKNVNSFGLLLSKRFTFGRSAPCARSNFFVRFIQIKLSKAT